MPNIFNDIFFLNIAHPDLLWIIILFLTLVILIGILRVRSISSLILRIISVLCFIIALSIPYKSSVSIFNSPDEILLLDVSYSMNNNAILSCLDKTNKLIDKSNLEIYPFSKELHNKIKAKDFSVNNLDKIRTQNITNFEASLNKLSEKISANEIVLCSDGHEHSGDMENVFAILNNKSIKINPIYPDTRTLKSDQINIKTFTGPLFKSFGEPFTFKASIENPLNEDVKIITEFNINNTNVNKKEIVIKQNSEIIIDQEFKDVPVGLHKINLILSNPQSNDKNHQRSRWIEVKEKPGILLISTNRSESTLTNNLLKTLGYDYESVILNSDKLPENMESFSGVILNNVKASNLPIKFQRSLKEFTKDGSGLLILGGDKSYGLGGYAGSIIEELSPLKSVPPRAKVKRLPSAVVLIIDKSGSMKEYGRMTSSRLAALETIKNMKDEDYISIIGFDHAPMVVMDLQKVKKAKQQAAIRLRNLTSNGATNLLPALSRARYRLSKAPAGKKHLIILTDGILPNKSSSQFSSEINKVKQAGISMSTIALGHDADVPFMKFLASEGKGSFYQVMNPQTLPRIFLDDVKIAIGEDTMKEQSEFPVNIGPAGMNSSTIKRFPHLLGFVETEAKNRARVELITRKHKSVFPMFASWNYGAGKVFAFASDLQGRWSSPWTRWTSIGPFWDDIFNKLKGTLESTSDDINFDIRYSIKGEKIDFELFIYDKELAKIKLADAGLLNKATDNTSKFQFKQKEKGRYTAQVEIKNAGDYILSLLFEDIPLPPIGLSIHPSELGEVRGDGVNFEFLQNLANKTGGVLNPSKEDLKLKKDEEVETSNTFTLPFIILGFLILLLEIYIRERRRLY